MKQETKKIKASTQKFTEILDIKENIVLLTNNTACLVIELQATNFSLLSVEEQQAKLYAYASLLNSLSCQIQIIIRNKHIDISSYQKHLAEELQKAKSAENTQEQQKKIEYLSLYKTYIENLTKVETILDKKFYVVLSFSSLETGAVIPKKEDLFVGAKTSLHTKAESLLTELHRLGVGAKILNKEELIVLFYDIYNEETLSINGTDTTQTTIVQGT